MSASSTLRRQVRWRVRKTVRASCMVIVEAPCTTRPFRTSVIEARTIPSGSTPPCWKKLLSSEASTACWTTGGISLSLSITRRSRAKVRKTLPFLS